MEAGIPEELGVGGITSNGAHELGFVTASAGDLNGDGFEDVVFTSTKEDPGTNGSAFVHYGGPNGQVWTTQGLSGGRLGHSAIGIGRFNDDPYDDLALGEPDFGAAEQGRVQIFLGGLSGLSSTPDFLFDGSQDSDAQTGYALAALGDLNGDGFDDFAVGEPGADNPTGGSNEGLVQVIYGGSTLPAVLTSGDEIVGMVGERRLGTTLAGVGDVDDNGYPDLLTANPGYNQETGRVELFLGDASGLSAFPDQFWEGGYLGEEFGASIAPLGDGDGDGFADVIIGVPGHMDSTIEVGRVDILTGSAAPQPLVLQHSYFGDAFNQKLRYGLSVAGLGDINADGFPDLFVGRQDGSGQNFIDVIYPNPFGSDNIQEFGDCVYRAGQGASVDGFADGTAALVVGQPNWDANCTNTGGPAPGRVEAFDSRPEGLVQWALPDWGPFIAPQVGDLGGAALGTADFNGDGFDDVLVGAPLSGPSDGGEVMIFFGGPDGPDTVEDVTLQAPPAATSMDQFGAAVAGVGDVNQDGYEDVVVGAPGFSNLTGQAFLFLGAASPSHPQSPTIIALQGNATGDLLGAAVSGAGDVDGDGKAEFLVGSPGWNGEAGRVLVCTYDGSISCGWSIESINSGEKLGSSVAAGDVTGDGLSDIIAGAPFADGHRGRVDVFQGDPNFYNLPMLAGVPINGQHPGGFFGSSVAYAGDVSGDAFGEFVVGEPDYSGPNWSEEGRVHVKLGAGSHPYGNFYWDYEGGLAQLQVGGTVAAGDFNGDGVADPVFNAATDPGEVYVVDGNTDYQQMAPEWIGIGSPGTGFGASLTTGDYNGDGFDDLIVGSPQFGAGEASGYPGNRGKYGAQPSGPLNVTLTEPPFAPVPPGGLVSGPEVVVTLPGRTPLGRTGAVLEVEVRTFPDPLEGVPTHTGPATTISNRTAVPDLELAVQGLVSGEAYRVQARLRYERNFLGIQRYTHWVSPGGPGRVTEPHFRRDPFAPGDDDDSAVSDDDDAAPDDDDTAPDDDDTIPDDDDSGADDDDSAPDDDDSAVADDDDSGDPGVDADGDGFTVGDGDCDDDNPQIHPNAQEECNGIDDDCSGAADEGLDFDSDGDGAGGCGDGLIDCAPFDPSVHPGAVELCDGLDSNCDGAADEEDADGDGVLTCADDCDDDPATGADRFPGNPEICGDGVDQDCNGSDEDSDEDGDGHTACGDDCNDAEATVHPGAPEICDLFDNDCDGQLGSGNVDTDLDGWANCNDCNVTNPAVHPGAVERCNGLDDDCDGFGLPEGEIDHDGDSFLPCGDLETGDFDCDNTDPAIHGWAVEDCSDGADNNCNGLVDEDVDADLDGQTTCGGDCNDRDSSVNSLSVFEQCDGRDEDCNGLIDDGPDADNDGQQHPCDCDDEDDRVQRGALPVCGDGVDNDCDPWTSEDNDVDRDGDGFFICLPPAGDCRDGNVLIHPDGIEVCDGLDNNCDGRVDELWDADQDEWLTCRFDCNDGEFPVHPGAEEVCHNGIDEDCDGDPDELCPDPVRVLVPPGHACMSCEGGAAAILVLPLLGFGRRRRR